MPQYLYLSFTPEALIFSMLPPQEFGKYLAIGDKKQSRSHAIYIDLDPTIDIIGLQMETARGRCAEHEDGTPRHSAYASIYRALERVSLSMLGDLHLATKDGLVLTLKKGQYTTPPQQSHYLYQEICPVSPRVVSTLNPYDFNQYVTHPKNPLFLPRIAFADMKLGELANDPAKGIANNLPYPSIAHMRECLLSLDRKNGKKTKIERRGMRHEIMYYMIEKGFYLGDQDDFIYYPMPDEDALFKEHNRWWNSASKIERY